MFYVSSIKGDTIGVLDTADNVEVFTSNREIVRICESKEADIYGVSIFNHKATCTIININQIVSESKLEYLLGNWRGNHNPWEGVKVEDYLASLRVGTVIKVLYSYQTSSGRLENSETTIKKLSYDKWLFTDKASVDNGSKVNHRRAANCLEIAYIYSKPKNIICH